MAIIITVMIFNLEPPESPTQLQVTKLVPQLLGYLESFLLIGIFWYKHNKFLSSIKDISGRVVWANLLFLFFLSLIPLVTNWAMLSSGSAWPRFSYGVVLLSCFLSFFFMQWLAGIGVSKVALLIVLGNLVSSAVALLWPWLAYLLFGILGVFYAVYDERPLRIKPAELS